MLDHGDLEKMLHRLDTAEPCEKHGRDMLAICERCKETVRCLCGYGCQCWNDE